MRVFFTFWGAFLVFALACRVLGVGVPAGTTIELVAQGTYTNLLNQQMTAVPATASLIVAQVAGVAIDYDRSPVKVQPGKDVYIPLKIINLGNGNDAFNLTTTSGRNWNVGIVYDDNADGIHQDSEQWVITVAGLMIADGYTACFAKISVPPDATSGDLIRVNAQSRFDPVGATASAEIELIVPDGPTVRIINPTAESSFQTTSPKISISGTASCELPIKSVMWSTDTGSEGTCVGAESWAASDIPLRPGANVITVTVTDALGRTATDSLSVEFTDVGAPTVTITGPTEEPIYHTESNSIILSGNASDDVRVVSVIWSNDRGGSGTCAGTDSWTANVTLQPGRNEVTVTATDESGNSGKDVLIVNYSVDTTVPTVQITTPTSESTYTTNNGTIAIGGTASDDTGIASVIWSNDRGGSGTCAGTTNWIASNIRLSIGQNVITVTATDFFGKTNTDVITVTYTGIRAPEIEITGPTTGSTYSTADLTVSISGTAAHDAGIRRVYWSNNRGGSGVCIGTTVWSATVSLKTGQNVIVVTAESVVGTTSTDTLVVTRTSPEVTITGPTTSNTYTTDRSPLTITGTASDDVGIISVSWSNDRGESGKCSGTTSWTAVGIPLASGQNIITVTATDASGNTGTDVLVVIYTPVEQTPPDTTPPALLITYPTSEPTCARNCPKATVRGTVIDSGGIETVTWINETTNATGNCTLVGSSWSTGEIVLVQGENNIKVTARDTAGNAQTDTITITYIETLPGNAWLGLAMVSLPIIPDNTDPKVTTGFAGNGWCAFITLSNAYAVYPDKATWLEPAEQTPGRGFWAYFESASLPYGTIPPQNQPSTIRLHPGWNLIGTPFINEVTWDLSKITVREPGSEAKPLGEMGTVAAGYLWGWQQDPIDPGNGSYYLVYDAALVPGVENKMKPWRGYWIKAYKECDLILPPPQ
jgi:hypothetical protein